MTHADIDSPIPPIEAPPADPASSDASEALRLRDLLADAIGCVSEGFVLFDEDGRLVLCNERYRNAYPLLADLLKPGVLFADVLRTAVERGAAGPRVDDPLGWIEERLRRHTRHEEPSDHRLADGRWYRISEHATRTGGVVKILTDITQLKSHEEALAQSEARYRRLVEMAPYGIVVWDGERVRYANRAAARIFGCGDPAAMAAIPVMEDADGECVRLFDTLPPPVDEAPFAAPLEARISTPDGDVREVEVGVHPFGVEGGPAWFLVFNDVTERKKAERAIHQAQKMQAIGQLAGGIAHEFNNMLTAIGGFALMARRAPDDRARVEQCLGEIVKASDRAAGLTAQLLSFGRQDRAEAARPVRVAGQLDDLRRFLRPILGERYEVRADVRAPDAVVLIEPSLLHQTLVNLAINGRDAMPDGGPITVTVDRTLPDAAFWQRHADLRRGPYVTISVRDAGTGIAPDVLDRIFEPFFTTKEQGVGTGLGLSLVYSTVTRAGGTVEVASEPGQGTTFTLFLPAEGAAAPLEEPPGPGLDDLDAEAPEDMDDGVSMAATVLLVEDEEQVRDFIRLTLEDMGMRVVTAADGPEALNAFAAHGGAFDLLVTDLVMPKMSGAEVARTLRRESPDLPIVLISGYPPETEILDDLLADTRRVIFLHKPINPDELAGQIHALVV
ncbi:PAS domain-containing hybrid sensor histidine kinase/response regulator [Azospirillum sp.]|uniref:PAS domain-containing hybrid sensor histidine kinase/response regulator n=1 Tax=Azospirillum sp. TaxID=34012 RepID=UPI002D23E1D1|nr:ATP-binding protein [Azospirillum sp.]HYD69024.1 ATP-binding protein [Azospirillum sp.]